MNKEEEEEEPASAQEQQQQKKQKQNDMLLCQPVAVAPTTQQQQQRICNECHQSLPNHLFPKKKFAKEQHVDIDICRQCKKNQTAKRCKQPSKENAKQGRKSDSGIIRRPNNFGYCDYVDKLFSLNCFPDIVSLKAFTSAKDVSESMAAIQAAGQYGLQQSNQKNGDDNSSSSNKERKRVKCLCIGDGSTPRTAVLTCYLKQWDCVSIDPALQEDWHGLRPKGVRGLVGFKGTLEEFMNSSQEHEEHENAKAKQAEYDHLALLCVHSHARLNKNASVDKIMARYGNIPTTLVSLPCCPTFRSQKDVGRAPDHVYEDDCVFSQCRKVEIWNFV